MSQPLPMISDEDLHEAYRLARVDGAIATTLTIMRELGLRDVPSEKQRDAFTLRMLGAGYVYLQIDDANVWRRREEITR